MIAIFRLRTLLPCLLLTLVGTATVQAAGLSASIVDQDGNPVDNAVLYVESIDGRMPEHAPREDAVIQQIDRRYVPHVLATTVGTRVDFPNADDVQHHVYSFSEAKTFEIPLYRDVPPEPVLFDRPGVVDLGCNIHDHMRAYVLVLETPYFARSQAGSAAINNIPGAELVVKLWHPRLESGEEHSRHIQLSPSETQTLEYRLNLKPELQTRRAPRRGSRPY